MRLFGCFVVIALLATVSARSEPNAPDIASAALAYRKSLQSSSGAETSAALLAAIRQAQNDRNLPEVVHLYERLAAQSNTYRSWLKLGLAWKDVDRSADGGLNAAWNAYGAAHSTPDQVEALLLMSSVLRSQLSATSESYSASRDELTDIERNLRGGDGNAVPCTTPASDAGKGADAAGSVALLCANKAQLSDQIQRDSDRLGLVARDLDAIYAEIANKLPGLDVKKMQDADGREKDFVPTPVLENGAFDISFKLADGTTQSCVEFTEDLDPNASAYARFVDAKYEPPAADPNAPPVAGPAAEPAPPLPKWSRSVAGRRLCLDNLGAGLPYRIFLKKGLPSKLGMKLAKDLDQQFTVPDFPKQIRFAGGRFVLPTAGGGTIGVHATNLRSIDLELYRISDRTLYRQIALGYIGGSRAGADMLPESEYVGVSEHFGELLWRGTLTMPRRWKPNQSIGAEIRARELLNQRRDWLAQQVAAGRRAEGERLSSGVRPGSLASEDEAGSTGEFFADGADFEAAAQPYENPGVYALVAQPADRSRCAKEGEEDPAACDRAVQWFIISDIGVTFYEGANDFSVALRSLETGEAVRGKVQLVTASNRVLGQEVETDEFGIAKFPRSLTRGTQSNALAAIMAQKTGDFAFMTFNAERLDLSKLNIDGRALPQGVDAFLTTDRGIYEPGQAIELAAILRDGEGRAVEAPSAATIRLESRGRVLSEKSVAPGEWRLGGLHEAVTVPKDARPGPVRIVLSLGQDENTEIGETLVHVGAIAPDRVEVQFPGGGTGWTARATDGKLEAQGPISARYLFAAGFGQDFAQRIGAAHDLKVEAVARVSAGELPKAACYEGYAFGSYDEKPITVTSRTFVQLTNANGKALLDLAGIDVPVVTKPAAVSIDVTVYDDSGPLGGKSLALPIDDGKGWIGIVKAPTVHQDPASGKVSLDLDVMRLTTDNRPEGEHSLEISLARERDSYSWEKKTDGPQQYTKTTSLDPPEFQRTLSSSELVRAQSAGSDSDPCVRPERLANLFHDVDVGRYVLQVRDVETGRIASTRIQIGSAQTDPDRLEPNLFVLASDKDEYRTNEAIQFTAETPFDGPVLLALAQGDVEKWVAGRAENGAARISFTPPPEWAGKGFYALATVFRDGAKNAQRVGPDRAIGAKFIRLIGAPRGFAAKVALLPPAGVRPLAPGESLKFRVCVGGSENDDCASEVAPAPETSGGDVYAIAYVVDEGLLGLTGHNSPPPDPQTYFFGRRRLDVRIMDTYGRMLPSTGGDRPGRLALSNYTSDRVVAFAKGPLKLERGRIELSFDDLALSSGKLSIYVLVWSKDFVTSASAEASTASPVVADLGAPNFLLAGDRAVAPLRIVNLEFPHKGDFAIRVSAKGVRAQVGFASDAKGEEISPELRFPLDMGATKTASLVVEPDPTSRGDLTVSIDVDAEGSAIPLRGSHREWTIHVGAPGLSSVRTLSFPLQAAKTPLSSLIGKFVTDNYDPSTVLVTARFADSASALLNASRSEALYSDARLVLDRLAVRAMAFFADRHKASDPASRPEGERLLGDILSLQLKSGAFLPYRTLKDPNGHEFNGDTDTEAGALAVLGRIATVLDVFSLATSTGYQVSPSSIADARAFALKTIKEAELSTPGLHCSFEALHATLALVDTGEVDDDQIDDVVACSDPQNRPGAQPLSVEQRAAAAAIAARFGRADTARVTLASFAKDAAPAALTAMGGSEIGQLRLAMIADFLARADAPSSVRESVAAALLDGGRDRISPAAAAWLTRDASPPAASTLDPTDLHLEGSGLGPIRVTAGGVLETDGVSFDQLKHSPTVVSLHNGLTGRGYVSIEGILSNPKADDALPAGAVRRRIFDLESAREIDPKSNAFKVGDRLMIVLEGDGGRLAKVYGDVDGEPAQNVNEPIVLADLLPSAFKVVSQAPLCDADLELPAAVKKLEAIGDLRAIDSNPDRWVALVVPHSRWAPPPPAVQPDSPAAPASEPDSAPAPDQPAPASAATCGMNPKAAGDIDFRQAYIVRVNLAGRFVWPGVLVEPSTRMADSFRSEATTLNVAMPAPPTK